MGALFTALATGRTGYYTAPLKALVSEKFFDLVDLFGSANVGMVTGDSAINPGAPIICCTAEILANQALRDGGAGADGDALVCMDEFHFYADPQRGWAWQVPLLELTGAQFLLMSATLGDVSFFATDLRRRTGTDVVVVADAERPVPLTYAYSVEPIQDLLLELVQTHRPPCTSSTSPRRTPWSGPSRSPRSRSPPASSATGSPTPSGTSGSGRASG